MKSYYRHDLETIFGIALIAALLALGLVIGMALFAL